MKSSIQHLILAGIFSLIALSGFSQATAQMLIDGSPVGVTSLTKFPFWLSTGHSIAIGTNVTSISAIEYNVTTSPAGGNILTLSGVKYITTTYTVAANQTLKVEGVMLNPAVSGGGNQWLIGGNAAPGSTVIGSTDNSPISLQSGTGTLGVGAEPFSKTINVGNNTGATTVNVTTGTGGFNVTTPAATNATTTLGTTGGAVFGSTTANADKIAIQPQTTSGATNTGTLTSADLTAARTYTLPDANGTVAVSASGNIALSATGNVTLTGVVPSTNGGTGVNNAGTITNASNTTITGGGTLALGGNTFTVPSSGTAALGTGTNNYNTYWSGTNTLSAEQFTSVTRGGLGADMTATGIGSIPYSTGTAAYTSLPDVAAGSYLRSGGVNTAPVWSGITLPNSATTAGELWYSSGTGTMAALPRHATQGTILMNNAGGTPSWATLASLPSTSGIIPAANLGTGTPTGTTFLNGTGAWSVPSVTLSGGTNTALTFWNSATTIGAATTGTPANGMYWDDANGRLGVGTASPSYKLHVLGASNFVTFENTSAVAEQYSQLLLKAGTGLGYLWTANQNSTQWGGPGSLNIYSATGNLTLWANGLEKMRILTTGEVGVGTTSPLTRFQVSMPTNASSMTLGSATGVAFSVVKADEGYGLYAGISGNGDTWLQTGRTNTATAYNLLLNASGGRVGIGTTAPSRLLELQGTIPGIKITDPNATGNAFIELSTVDGGLSYFQNTQGRTRIVTGGAERVAFLNNGNVGINTASPTATLEVNGTVSAPGLTLQTVYNKFTTTTTTTTTFTYADVTSSDLSITAKRSGSIFKITVNGEGYFSGSAACNLGIKYVGTNTLIQGVDGGSGDSWMGSGNRTVGAQSWNITKIAFHNPGTVAGTTYTYRAMLGLWSQGQAWINYAGYNASSIITIEEIGQ